MITEPGDSTASAAQKSKPPTEAQDTASSFDDGVGDKKQPDGISLWGKVKQHFRHWWWVYLIAIVILLAILLPLL